VPPAKQLPLRDVAEDRVRNFAEQTPKRTGSLIISIFGDAIAPHGGTVWIGSLIEALAPFGINQRLVRTSVFRLTKERWLAAEQVGRRSYYGLTDIGRRLFQAASRRIYSEPRQDWSGHWQLVLLTGMDAGRREEVRRSLGWLGFAPFSPSLLAHPSPDLALLHEELRRLDPKEKLLLMTAEVDETRQARLRTLVRHAWSLDELSARYSDFLADFRPAYQAARKARRIEPLHAFQLRTLLIHEYRKILLRDPCLPDVLLPGSWDGIAAYQLCRNLYRLVAPAAESYLQDHMESADGPLPPAEPRFYQRFNGGNEADEQSDD
jgi:phenylacetic acid degradation operon negative regulatory protein